MTIRISAKEWFKRLLSGQPHYVIGGADNPYLYRWYLIPRNRRLNFYLHKFMRDDDDQALHDHPWWFLSLILKGGYVEFVGDGSESVVRKAGDLAYRAAEHRHRVVLPIDTNGRSKPCWTFIIAGRTSRTWGFWCPKGFVPWYEFVEQDDKGNIGRGCE